MTQKLLDAFTYKFTIYWFIRLYEFNISTFYLLKAIDSRLGIFSERTIIFKHSMTVTARAPTCTALFSYYLLVVGYMLSV